MNLFPLLSFETLRFTNSFLLLFLEARFHHGSYQDVCRVEEPDLSVVVLEEVTIDRQYLLVVQLLNVEAHFEDLSQAVVFRAQLFQFIFNHLVYLEIRLLLINVWFWIIQELISVLAANLLIVILQAQCLCVSKLTLGLSLGQGDSVVSREYIVRIVTLLSCLHTLLLHLLLLIVIQLHRELNRYVLSQAFLRLDTRLDAVEGSPLSTSCALTHSVSKLALIENSDNLAILSNMVMLFVRIVMILSWNRLLPVAYVGDRILFIGQSRLIRIELRCGR